MLNGVKTYDFWNDELRKFKVISLFAGGGAMTSAFVNTQACESVFAVDSDIPENNPNSFDTKGKEPGYMSWTIETFRRNFSKTLIILGRYKECKPRICP